MCEKCFLHGSHWVIEVTMGEIKNLAMFNQVDDKELCDQGLEIIETNL